LSIFGSVASVLEETVDTLTTPKKTFGGEKQRAGGDDAVDEKDGVLAPWHVEPNQAEKEGVLKAQILNLSQEKWTFMQSPHEENLEGFEFSMETHSDMAIKCLKLDPQLEKMRWLLVPWKVREEVFWRNYFAHIYTVRNAILVSKMDEKALDRASAEHEVVGKRNLDEDLSFLDDIEAKDDDDIVELSSLSIDGMSLEDQINAALNEE
jgi:hypothetical protein